MNAAGIAVPVEKRYFEDYIPGSVIEGGCVTLSEDDVLDFARRFDPQYIHTDPRAAADGPFHPGQNLTAAW